MRNESWNYRQTGIVTLVVSMLGILLLPSVLENNQITSLSTGVAPDTGAGIQHRSKDPLHADALSAPVVIPTAIPATGETTDTERIQDIAVWGSITTGSGAVTHHDRVLFYSLSLNKSYETFSDPKGYFYIDRMTPATDYGLWIISAGMFRKYVRRNLIISAEQSEFFVVLDELAEGTLTGNLVNVDGDAVPGFGLKIRSSEKDLWTANFITDRFGNFQIDQVPFGTLEFLSTFGPASRITGHEFDPDLQLPITLMVDHGPYDLNAMILDEFNNPVPRANVVLNWVSTDGKMRSVVTRQVTTDATGRFSMKNVGSGAHDLMISTADGSSHQQTIDINSLSSDLRIFLGPGP